MLTTLKNVARMRTFASNSNPHSLESPYSKETHKGTDRHSISLARAEETQKLTEGNLTSAEADYTW